MKLLKAKTIFTSEGSNIIRDGAVLINDQGRIEAVGSIGQIPSCPDAEVFDHGDATVLPGLMDLHVHLGYWQTKLDGAIYAQSPGLIALMAADELKTCFAQGVTTVRTVGDSPEGLGHTIKTGLAKGFIEGPRYISSNKAITSTGGHAYIINVEADGPDGFRKAVRQQIKDGADWIKLMASHRLPTCELTQDELNAAVDEAHNWGKKCCIHAASEISVERAINAGVDSLEHASFMTVAQAERARDKGIAWVPTLFVLKYYLDVYLKPVMDKPAEERAVYEQQLLDESGGHFFKSVESMRKNVSALAATGIKIGTGTDSIFDKVHPLTPVGEEMLLLEEHGVDPLETIRAATSNAAEILGLENETGCVKQGLSADLLVVDGDLTAELKNIRNIAAVYYGGRLMHSKA